MSTETDYCQRGKTLAVLSKGGRSAKCLTITAWHGHPAKLDLRTWRDTAKGQIPGRGVTLTDSEARRLLEALEHHYRRPNAARSYGAMISTDKEREARRSRRAFLFPSFPLQ